LKTFIHREDVTKPEYMSIDNNIWHLTFVNIESDISVYVISAHNMDLGYSVTSFIHDTQGKYVTMSHTSPHIIDENSFYIFGNDSAVMKFTPNTDNGKFYDIDYIVNQRVIDGVETDIIIAKDDLNVYINPTTKEWEYTVTNVKHSITLYPGRYKKNYRVNTQFMSNVTIPTSFDVDQLEGFTFNIVPDNGYIVKSIMINGAVISSNVDTPPMYVWFNDDGSVNVSYANMFSDLNISVNELYKIQSNLIEVNTVNDNRVTFEPSTSFEMVAGEVREVTISPTSLSFRITSINISGTVLDSNSTDTNLRIDGDNWIYTFNGITKTESINIDTIVSCETYNVNVVVDDAFNRIQYVTIPSYTFKMRSFDSKSINITPYWSFYVSDITITDLVTNISKVLTFNTVDVNLTFNGDIWNYILKDVGSDIRININSTDIPPIVNPPSDYLVTVNYSDNQITSDLETNDADTNKKFRISSTDTRLVKFVPHFSNIINNVKINGVDHDFNDLNISTNTNGSWDVTFKNITANTEVFIEYDQGFNNEGLVKIVNIANVTTEVWRSYPNYNIKFIPDNAFDFIIKEVFIDKTKITLDNHNGYDLNYESYYGSWLITIPISNSKHHSGVSIIDRIVATGTLITVYNDPSVFVITPSERFYKQDGDNCIVSITPIGNNVMDFIFIDDIVVGVNDTVLLNNYNITILNNIWNINVTTVTIPMIISIGSFHDSSVGYKIYTGSSVYNVTSEQSELFIKNNEVKTISFKPLNGDCEILQLNDYRDDNVVNYILPGDPNLEIEPVTNRWIYTLRNIDINHSFSTNQGDSVTHFFHVNIACDKPNVIASRLGIIKVVPDSTDIIYVTFTPNAGTIIDSINYNGNIYDPVNNFNADLITIDPVSHVWTCKIEGVYSDFEISVNETHTV